MELNQSNNIHYYTEGKGTPLYLIHGFPDCAENFEHQINFFAERGFKVIVPYLPGYHENDQVLDTQHVCRNTGHINFSSSGFKNKFLSKYF